jgi:hypothetical protein
MAILERAARFGTTLQFDVEACAQNQHRTPRAVIVEIVNILEIQRAKKSMVELFSP